LTVNRRFPKSAAAAPSGSVPRDEAVRPYPARQARCQRHIGLHRRRPYKSRRIASIPSRATFAPFTHLRTMGFSRSPAWTSRRHAILPSFPPRPANNFGHPVEPALLTAATLKPNGSPNGAIATTPRFAPPRIKVRTAKHLPAIWLRFFKRITPPRTRTTHHPPPQRETRNQKRAWVRFFETPQTFANLHPPPTTHFPPPALA